MDGRCESAVVAFLLSVELHTESRVSSALRLLVQQVNIALARRPPPPPKTTFKIAHSIH